MTPKDLRAFVREHAHACPNCGSALLIESGGDAEYARLWKRFAELVANGTAYIGLESAEEAEANLRAELDAGVALDVHAGQTLGNRDPRR